MESTTIQLEYPVEYDVTSEEENVPFYCVTLEKNKEIFKKYRKLSEEYENITFIGRLTEYETLQMDEVVEKVLKLISEKFTGLSTEY